jgi:hypothetical protein
MVDIRRRFLTLGRLLMAMATTLAVTACATAQTPETPAARPFSNLKGTVAQASSSVETRELRIQWTPARADAARTRATVGTFTLLGQVRFAGAPRRERQPEPSANDLVIVVQDSTGRDLDWRIIPNPRLIRAETPDQNGVLSGRVIERDQVELLVYIPDVAGADRIQIFSPVWNGKDYTLDPLGQLTIGSSR